MKFGFELEAFCFNEAGEPILVPKSLPFDECGWLVEVRSEPHTSISMAMALLGAEKKVIDKRAEKAGVKLLYEPTFKIPRDLKVKAGRVHGKGIISYLNVYGHETHKNNTDLATASLHVSFTEEQTFNYSERSACKECSHTEYKKFKYQGFIDHAKFIVGLDVAFKAEIAKARRNPGFYERKSDGRIEYRSLPNNVDLDKVVEVLEKLTNSQIED